MVSVVVPVYNSENTLNRCVSSILKAAKTYDLELILVNDGSQDGTDAICREFAEQYDNVIYVTQENKGVSAARNNGISIASGEWIHFVDSDDWIEPNLYKGIEFAEQNPEVEFIMFRYESGEKISENVSSGEIQERTELVNSVLKNKQYGGYCWNKIFKKSILKKYNIIFSEEIKLCEDQLFQLRYMQYIQYGYVMEDRLYHYVILPGTSKYNLEKSISSVKAYDEILHMSIIEENEKALFEARTHYVSNCLKTIVRAVKQHRRTLAHEYKVMLKPYAGIYLKNPKPCLRNKTVLVMVLLLPVI